MDNLLCCLCFNIQNCLNCVLCVLFVTCVCVLHSFLIKHSHGLPNCCLLFDVHDLPDFACAHCFYAFDRSCGLLMIRRALLLNQRTKNVVPLKAKQYVFEPH